MTRIIIAGDSWGVYSYEGEELYPNLTQTIQTKKKGYFLYPGPGELLSEVTDTEIINTAGRGYSNTEALDALEKMVTKDDIVIFYQSGMLREVYKAHLAKEVHHATESFVNDFTNAFIKAIGLLTADAPTTLLANTKIFFNVSSF